jgi:hypothetical protein
VIDIVPSNFEIPENATKIRITNKFGNESTEYQWVDPLGVPYKAEKIWIPRRYEATRLGTNIYVDCREVPNQPINIENPYKDFELSYKGRIFNNLNSDSVSAVQRAVPYQFQYFYVKHIQNRELAKYMGYVIDIDVDQIPDHFETDFENNKIPGRDKVAMHSLFMKKLGRNYYSGSQSAEGGGVPATRSPGTRSSVTSAAGELLNLGQLLNMIDMEIGMAMGISPQREAMFSSNSNVSDNQQAITQSHHITEPLFYMHSQVWKCAVNDWLKLFRTHCQNFFERNPQRQEHFLQYITPGGTRELLKITPDLLQHTDLGIFIDNSANSREYREIMTNHSFAFAQNAGEGMEAVSSLIKAITSNKSPEEIHKMIQVEAGKQQARMERMEKMQMEMQEKLAQKEIEHREDIQAHDKEIEFIKGDYKLADTELKINADGNQEDGVNENDQDGVMDSLENIKAMKEIQNMDREQARKDRELQIKEKQAKQKAVKSQ